MDAPAYDLFWDMAHIKGTVYDATLVPFEGSDYICGWIGPEPHQVPEPVLFEANFKVTQRSDYPCNDVGWPLMSPRMLEVLRAVGNFPHRLIPVRLVNRRVLGPARYLPDGSLRPEVVDDRFAAVQLTEHIDVIDWDRSSFQRSQIDRVVLYDFDKIVLKEPPGGLPPLFRIPANSGTLYISAEARSALEAAGIRGIQFLSLPGARTIDSPEEAQHPSG